MLGHDTLSPPKTGTVYDKEDVIIRITGRGTRYYGLFVVQCSYAPKQPWWRFNKSDPIPAYIVEDHPEFVIANSHREAVRQVLDHRDGLSYVFMIHPKGE